MSLTEHHNTNDLVSIIIPCYNGEKFIAEAIDSALRQSHSNIEVIVVDDGSVDQSWEIIQSYSQQIHCFSIPHQGAPVARNFGLRKASGDFIQFLDADDLMAAEKVEKCLAAFEPDVDAVYSNRILFYQEDDRHKRSGKLYKTLRALSKNPFFNGETYSKIKQGEQGLVYNLNKGIQTSCPLHRSESIMQAGGFNPHLKAGQEFELHSRMFLAGAVFKEISDHLIRIRIHSGVDRISNSPESLLNQLKALTTISTSLQPARLHTAEIRKALARRYFAYAARAYNQNNPMLAKTLFEKSQTLHKPTATNNYVFDFLVRIYGFRRACGLKKKMLARLS